MLILRPCKVGISLHKAAIGAWRAGGRLSGHSYLTLNLRKGGSFAINTGQDQSAASCLWASLIFFLYYSFLLVSHFFACFFGTVQCISPLLYSWAIAGCECFPLDLPLCRWPSKLPGHTVRVGVAHKELRALDFGGLFFLCNILDSLQSKYFFFFFLG